MKAWRCSIRVGAFLCAILAVSHVANAAQEAGSPGQPPTEPDAGSRAMASPRAGELPFSKLSYSLARDAAAQQGKLFVVDCTAVWCVPCAEMERATWPDSKVAAWLAEHAIAVQVDVDAHKEITGDLRINALPTIIVFRGDTELDRREGKQDAAQLVSWLDAVRLGHAGHDPLHAEGLKLLASDDVQARCDIAHELTMRGDYQLAMQHYEWVWPNWSKLRDSPELFGVRTSRMLLDLKRLARADDDCNETVTRLWMEVRRRVVRTSSPDAESWIWFTAWASALDHDNEPIDWYEHHRDPDGSVQVDDVVRASLLQLLITHRRWADAGRLGNLSALAERSLADYRALKAGAATSTKYVGARRRKLLESGQMEARTTLGQLSGAAWAAHHDDEARRLANTLLAELDDAESRIILVELTYTAVGTVPEQAVWLAEAEANGGSRTAIAALRDKLGISRTGSDSER